MIAQLKELLDRCIETPAAENELVSFSKQMSPLNDQQVKSLLNLLLEFSGTTDEQVWPRLVSPCLGRLVSRHESQSPAWGDDTVAQLAELYCRCPSEQTLRNQILALLADMETEMPLRTWCRLVCENPPLDRRTISIAFAPLMHADRQSPAWLLEQLLSGATKNVSVAAAVFDLLNFYARTQGVDPHPAAGRAAELRDLLGELVGQLARIEEGNLPAESDPSKISQVIGDSVALIVSLCDTLAIIGDEQAIGKLNQAIQLRHRRIQAEAAAALAALADEQGKQHLIQLAAEPITRLRILAYARDLGFENEISLEHRGEIAMAESHLAMWLAEPSQMGMAPSRIQLIENRELNWPSYEQPMQCFLFRFFYGASDDAYSNIGISGPLTHAFESDIKHLPTGDMYAAFAGWQTVHQEIFIVPFDRAEKILAAETKKLNAELARQDFADAVPQVLASFFGQYVLVASASNNHETGTAIIGLEQADWIASGSPQAPIDWQLALDIWRGRKLLANFNPDQQG